MLGNKIKGHSRCLGLCIIQGMAGSLLDMVSSLREGSYKDYYSRHIKRGMHPAEELFAKYALLALSPGERSQEERRDAAKHILCSSLESLPYTQSTEVFRNQIEARFPRGILDAQLEIEEMIFVSNIASALAASANDFECQAAERVLWENIETLRSWSSITREAASPVVIKEGLFWLYYMDCDLRGVCMHSLPGVGQGMPVVFISSEYFHKSAPDRDALLRIACHEMLHSSQAPQALEKITGWNLEAKRALLEAITEGLAILEIGQKEPFSPEEISKRDYAYLVVALFNKMKKAGIAPHDFKKFLRQMNSRPLSETAALIGPSDKFMREIRNAAHSLLLQNAAARYKEKGSAGQEDTFSFLEGMLFSGDNGLQIIYDAVSVSR